MSTAMTSPSPNGLGAVEACMVQGDLKNLTQDQRLTYYKSVCESLGLNPLTRPFEYITLNGRMVLYARRDAGDQLRRLRNVSIEQLQREVVEGVYVVTATAKDGTGRRDESIGAVPIDGLKGEARANAMMKAETKAKRRVTLSICGLGFLDETEIDSIPDARPAPPPALAAPSPDPDPIITPRQHEDIMAGLTQAGKTVQDIMRKIGKPLDTPLATLRQSDLKAVYAKPANGNHAKEKVGAKEGQREREPGEEG